MFSEADIESLRRLAEAADHSDPLAFVRSRFSLPDGLIYLDGNSLGAMPVVVPDALADAAHRQ